MLAVPIIAYGVQTQIQLTTATYTSRSSDDASYDKYVMTALAELSSGL